MIGIVLDTTGSMGPSVEASQKAIASLSSILRLIGYEILVIAFGDFHHRTDTLEKVVGVYTADEFQRYKFHQFPHGGGGDTPEALASAFRMIFKLLEEGLIPIWTFFALVTDAYPHMSIGGDNAQQAKFEELALKRVGAPWLWPDVVEKFAGCGAILSTICRQSPGLEQCYRFVSESSGGTFVQIPRLDQPSVTTEILKIIDTRLEADVSLADSPGIDPEEFIKTFQEFALNNPTTLGQLLFLSKEYYKHVRSSRAYTDLHGQFFQKLLQLGGVDPQVIDLFKSAQVSCQVLEDLLLDFPKEEQPCVKYIGKVCSFATIKDALVTGAMTKEVMQLLRDCFSSFVICPSSDPLAVPLTLIQDDLCWLASIISMNQGLEDSHELPEYTRGILPMMVASIFQHCQVEEIRKVARDILEKDNFLPWLRPGSSTCVNDTWWNRIKLQYLMKGISRSGLDTEKTRQMTTVLGRLATCVEVVSLKDQTIPVLSVRTELGNLSRSDAVLKTDSVILLYDAALELWMAATLAFKCTHPETMTIIEKMRRHNNFFQKPESHYEKISQLSEKMGGLVLSIYSINCDVTDNVLYDQADGRRAGYQDSYSKKPYVTQEFLDLNPVPSDLDGLEKFLLERVGQNGERIFSAANLVKGNMILEGGPQMTHCGKKDCGRCYFRQDSSSLDRTENTRCGICRKGVIELPMYEITCSSCSRSFVSGIEFQGELDKEACPFCQIPVINKCVYNVSVFNLFSRNLELFSEYFGIPLKLFEKIVERKSMAKVFRIDPATPETACPLLPEIFDDHDWRSKKNVLDGSVIIYQGDTLILDSIDKVKELLGSWFRIECSICYDTCEFRWTKKFCSNDGCADRFCQACIKAQTSQVSPGQVINLGHLQCPMCRRKIKRGHFSDTVPALKKLFDGQKDQTLYDKMVETPRLKVYLCSNVDNDEDPCASLDQFPFEIDDRLLGCGEAMQEQLEEEEDGVAGAAQRHICSACLSREVERLAPREPQTQFEGIGELTETGHYRAIDEATGRTIHTRPCPKCNRIIELESGCFHITCRYYNTRGEPPCDAHFCWCCGKLFENRLSEWQEHPCYAHLRTECPYTDRMEEHNNPGYVFYGIPGHHEDEDEDEDD